MSNSTVSAGISGGHALAIVLSYVKWHSIGWAVVNGFFSWGYVFYFWIQGY